MDADEEEEEEEEDGPVPMLPSMEGVMLPGQWVYIIYLPIKLYCTSFVGRDKRLFSSFLSPLNSMFLLN